MTSILVMPLSPPFKQDVEFFYFRGAIKQLAVSIEDGARIKALFATDPRGRDVLLEPAEDGLHIRVSALQ